MNSRTQYSESPSDQASADPLEGLPKVEHALERMYYDSAADQLAKERYYSGIRPSENAGEKFASPPCARLAATHKTPLAYSPSQHVYPWVDLHDTAPRRTLRSIYSGQKFSPEELIEKDAAILHMRNEKLAAILLQDGSAADRSAIQDAVAAALPYNCEHVVPQSWFDKREPMRGDLHHLFACESDCNSFRGNSPYFDFEDFLNEIENEKSDR